MKKDNIKNRNGIAICDSIVMSVKNKRPYLRRLESVIIAVIGFVSVIMSFLGMFNFVYNKSAVFTAAIFFSIFYITLILINRKALWIIAASLLVLTGAAVKMLDDITEGFKFVYNIIYKESMKNDINYYKYVDFKDEEKATTILLIFGIWLIAFVIYFFTIYHPNMILPLIVTFPIIEIGLYNGIAIPIFWGTLTVSYWIAMFCITSTDMGEYSGGSGGFVRKNNVFSPKRQMKLKVTEKCGIFIIVSVMIVTFIASSVINITGYERSDELNRKRRELSLAFEEFSIENLAESLSKITGVFGLSFKYNNNKLGSKDHITYKNVTDLEVTFEQPVGNAVYIKDTVGSVYKENEWLELSKKKYDNDLFDEFKDNKIFPQDFPSIFAQVVNPGVKDMMLKIVSKVDKDRLFSPYGTKNIGGLSYSRDMLVSSLDTKSKEFSYNFIPIDTTYYVSLLSQNNSITFSNSSVNDKNWQNSIEKFCINNEISPESIELSLPFKSDLFSNNGPVIMTALLENKYRDFVYNNYLQLPDNKNMDEVRKEYGDIIDSASNAKTAAEKLEVLRHMREKMAADTEYTLSPGKTPSNRDFVNYFLIENQKGYCIHYASSGVLLARMAGIPARYATGYIIVAEDFEKCTINPDNTVTVDVQDNRSHAWVEVYLDGFGWIPYEFTAGYTERTISHITPSEVPETSEPPSSDVNEPTSTSPNSDPVSTSQQDATQTVTTTATAAGVAVGTGTATGTGNVRGIAAKDSGGIPDFVKCIIFIALTIAFMIALIFIRRVLILKMRYKRFNSGSASERINNMYRYSEQLLAILSLTNENGNYTEFSRNVEQHIGRDYFPLGDFSNFMDIALCSGFSRETPGADDITFCNKFVNTLAENIYTKSGLFKKIWYKIGKVII